MSCGQIAKDDLALNKYLRQENSYRKCGHIEHMFTWIIVCYLCVDA